LQVADQAPGAAERAGDQLQDAAGSATDAAKQGASQSSDAMQVFLRNDLLVQHVLAGDGHWNHPSSN